MSWRRRRRSIFDIFDEILRTIDEEFEEFERMFRRGFEEFEEMGPTRPLIYGFRITIGPDGKPVIEEFGNVRRVRGRPKISEEREPLVDVLEEEDKIVIVAEMPGVEKDKIKVKVPPSGDRLTIQASNKDRKYYKEVELPVKVKPETAKATYRNGVLEIIIEKAEKKKKAREEEWEVKVE